MTDRRIRPVRAGRPGSGPPWRRRSTRSTSSAARRSCTTCSSTGRLGRADHGLPHAPVPRRRRRGRRAAHRRRRVGLPPLLDTTTTTTTWCAGSAARPSRSRARRWRSGPRRSRRARLRERGAHGGDLRYVRGVRRPRAERHGPALTPASGGRRTSDASVTDGVRHPISDIWCRTVLDSVSTTDSRRAALRSCRPRRPTSLRAPPKRRSRWAYSRHARHRSRRSKSGHSTSWKTISA